MENYIKNLSDNFDKKIIKSILSKLYDFVFNDSSRLAIRLPEAYLGINILTDFFIPLYIRSNPNKNILYVTQSCAKAFSALRLVMKNLENIKDIKVTSPLKTNYIETDKNGQCKFVANGSAVCGFGCDLLIINQFSRFDNFESEERMKDEYLNKLCRTYWDKNKVLIFMYENEWFDIVNCAIEHEQNIKFDVLDLTMVK